MLKKAYTVCRIVKGGFYRHARTGRMYRVLDVAERTSDRQYVVVYERAPDDGLTWVRPLQEFGDPERFAYQHGPPRLPDWMMRALEAMRG